MEKDKAIEAANQAADDDTPMADEENENFEIYDDTEGGTRIGDIYIPPPVKPYCSIESKGPRLIITSITIENFKSYAGKVELGPFNHCTSAVMGPNGSGKSNVIDAMLFVFGYRAQKLRLKKLSLLLHNSSNAIHANHCSVYVYFKQIVDNPDGSFTDVPNTEFNISRTAYRDNSSHYNIDGKKYHFKEVAKLLKKHGVDLDHNRFLILQGEVESIAMMKPKALLPNECGLLEYLEDIVGTSRYKDPLIKINERVDTLNEERTEKHNRCKMSEREMKDLEQPWKEAIEYLVLENDLTSTQNSQFQQYIYELKITLKDFQTTQEKSKEELDAHDKNAKEIKDKLDEKESLVKEETKKCDQLSKEKEETTTRHRNALNKIAELAASLQSTNARRKTLMAQVEKEKTKLEEFKEVPEKNKQMIEDIMKKIETQNQKRTEQQKQLDENLKIVQDETKELIVKKDKLQTEHVDLQKLVDECKAQLNVAESELKMSQLQQTQESRKLLTLENAYKDALETCEESKPKITETQNELDDIKTRFEACSSTLKELQAEDTTMNAKLRALNADISEQQNSMQSNKSRGRVLQSLMDQKQNGKIPGILGRLGDLGGIDAKYDVAISTACGPLDNIVVDTVNTAQSCIEFLKRNDIGRGTFIALEKVKHYENQCRQKISTPENANRLFDLIRVEDERVLPAFYHALHDTLVANELEQASRIAYGATRYRVVTLKGEMIEISGKMSGGGRSMMRGRMGQTVATKTSKSAGTPNSGNIQSLERLQIQAQELREKISYNQEQQSQMDREITDLKKALQIKERILKTLTLDISTSESRLPRLKEQIQQQQKKVDECVTDPEKIQELQEKIKDKTALFKKSEENAKKISSQVEKITKKINEITDSKIKAVKDRIKTLKSEIDKLNASSNKLTVEISSSERNVQKTQRKIDDLKGEIELSQQSMIKDNELRGVKENEAAECTERVESLKKEIDEIQSKSSDVHKEITSLRKRENDGKLARMEIEQKIKEIDKQVAYHKSQIPLWEKKLTHLKYHIIPDSKTPQETLKVFTDEELEKLNPDELQKKITITEERLNSKKPNLSVIQEYEAKRLSYLERVQVLEDITSKRNSMRALYDEVRKKRYTEFMQGFNIISKKLKEMYQTITMGGDAELELSDSMDPFNEGIIFSVRPPKKSWKQISNLSGGEKTLSSLALVFALHYYKPSPLYVMDEIDAALDFKNVSIVANYIKQRARNAQFIIISLRANMFELCDRLVGIYKVKDCSSSISIENVTPEFAKSRLGSRNNNNPNEADIMRNEITDETIDNLPNNEIIDETIADIQNNEIDESMDVDENQENFESEMGI